MLLFRSLSWRLECCGKRDWHSTAAAANPSSPSPASSIGLTAYVAILLKLTYFVTYLCHWIIKSTINKENKSMCDGGGGDDLAAAAHSRHTGTATHLLRALTH